MTVDFRCENCGKLLSVDAAPLSSVKCPHCGRKASVPAGLASLPRPHVPPNAGPRSTAGMPAPSGGEVFEEEPIHDDAMMGVMARSMPWVISVFFHLSIMLLLMFGTMVVTTTREPENTLVPDAAWSDNAGGSLSAGSNESAPITANAASAGEFSPQESTIDSGQTSKTIQFGRSGGTSGASSGGNQGLLKGTGGGKGPHTGMFGTGGNAHHVVYVIDRSGSMLAEFDVVRTEMLTSISKLSEQQDFHIIFFSAGATSYENPPHQLVIASKEQKNDASVYLMKPELSPAGQTDPIPALKRAFEVLDRADSRKGKLIYLLTDGVFPDNKKVLELIAERNPKKEITIHTFLYGNVPPEAEEVMKKIALDTPGGQYKAISADE